jgi:hypothetical protein
LEGPAEKNDGVPLMSLKMKASLIAFIVCLAPDAQLEASGVRLAAEKSDAEVQQTAAREAAQAKYENCIRTAENTYSSSHAEQCKRVQEKNASDLRDCLSLQLLTKSSCEAMYGGHGSSSDCSLPIAIDSALSDQLKISRNRCLDESRTGLQ